MVAILLETKYADSLWCKKIHAGLVERLREKRIPFCEIYDSCPGQVKAVFIIGSDLVWTISAIKQLNKSGIVPILLCNQSENLPGCIYNCVCSDIPSSMSNLLDVLKAKGKTKLAIYGTNLTSISDISRTDSLMYFKDEQIEKMTLFVNESSLAQCFEKFYPVAGEYDGVICTNDFAAVSLVRNLRRLGSELADRLFIASCTSSKLSNYYSEHILSVNINYSQYGKAAVYIYEALQKHSYISGLTVKVAWELDREAPIEAPGDILIDPSASKDTFYDDPELSEMLIVDKLLTLSDSTDKKILDGLARELSYEQIAESCFLTQNAVKYRIKNLITGSGAMDKGHMTALFRKYIFTQE